MEECTINSHRSGLADLWGPLLISIGIAMLMKPISFSNTSAIVLIFQWLGAILLTVNCKLLGCNVFALLSHPLSYSSYVQMLSNIGYSSFPIFIHSCFHWMITLNAVNLLIGLFASVWSLRSLHPPLVFSPLAISTFLSRQIDNRRRVLILFPCLLYMFFISFANLCIVCSIQHSTQKQIDPPFRSSFSHSLPLRFASFPAATSSHFEAVSTLFFTPSLISTSRHRRRVFKPSIPAIQTHKIRLISTHYLILSIHQPFFSIQSNTRNADGTSAGRSDTPAAPSHRETLRRCTVADIRSSGFPLEFYAPSATQSSHNRGSTCTGRWIDSLRHASICSFSFAIGVVE